MKKIVIAAAIALCGFMSIPAQAQYLNEQPWRYVGYNFIRTGFFSPIIKACNWKRSVYFQGIYTAEMRTTYTSRFGSCPAPFNN